MTEPVRGDRAADEPQALVSAALHALARDDARGGAPLRASITQYVRARKSVGLRPEEVVIELKTEIARALQRRPATAAWSAPSDTGEMLAEQVIRLAIEAYFAE